MVNSFNMTTKYVQKGLNNNQKKELKQKALDDLIDSINEIQFIKDWYGIDDKRPLTTTEIVSKYNIPDGRYLYNILDKFNLDRRTSKENNSILGMKRREDRLNYLISAVDLQKFVDYHNDHTAPEMIDIFNITDKDYLKLLDYLKLDKHSGSKAQSIAQSHMPKEKKDEIASKRLASITPEVETQRRNKISVTSMNKPPEEKADIYSRAAATNKSRSPEQKKASKDLEYQTRLKNGTLWSSAPEDRFEIILKSVYGEDNVKREYNEDPRYPHRCDFYIPSLDLFIELNFHPSHWAYYKYKEPFDPNNEEHIEWCKLRKELGYTTWVWKHLDRQKIQDAYDNNLNYIAFYDQKSFENDEDIVYSLAKVRGVHIVPGAH